MTRTDEEATAAPSLSEPDVARFQRDGFLRLAQFFNREEVGVLRRVLERDPLFRGKIRTGLDHAGNAVELWITSRLGEDVLGAFVRSRHLVAAAEQLLGEEVYHWHHKIALKSPRVGGAWEWHQDFGYWYDYGCLFPDLVSCMIAVDAATVENGCLEVVRGSHRMQARHGAQGRPDERRHRGPDPHRPAGARARTMRAGPRGCPLLSR